MKVDIQINATSLTPSVKGYVFSLEVDFQTNSLFKLEWSETKKITDKNNIKASLVK